MKKNINVAVLDARKIIKMEVKFICPFDVIIGDTVYKIELVYDTDTKVLKGFVYEENKKNVIKYVVQNLGSLNLPETLSEYYNAYKDRRYGVVTWNFAGGNASKNAISNKISIPRIWLDVMNIDENERDIKLTFNGSQIVMEKKID